jgi:hypothetical protein
MTASDGRRALLPLFHLCLLYAAATAATGWILLWHSSDTILSSLISLDRWVPYYWGESRFGMLIPLLAAPVRDPGMNLMFQTLLTVWSGLLAIDLMWRLCGGKTTAFSPPR